MKRTASNHHKISYASAGDHLPPEVRETSRFFNDSEYDELLDLVTPHLKVDDKTGIDYVLLQTSITSGKPPLVVLHFNPFANGMDENMQLRSLYLYTVLGKKFVGRDVVFFGFSSPSASKALKLTRKGRRRTAKGDFRHLADRYLEIVARQGYKEFCVLGFSQGASLAAAVAAHAGEFDLRASKAVLGEPANVEKRSVRRLGNEFRKARVGLKPAIDDSGLRHLQRFYLQQGYISYGLSLARNGRMNLSLVRGLAKDTFIKDLSDILVGGASVTLGWSDHNKISEAKVMQEILASFDGRPEAENLGSFEVAGADHAWADRLDLLAHFYIYGLSEAAK